MSTFGPTIMRLRRNRRLRDAVARASRREKRIGDGTHLDFGLLCVDEGIRIGLAMAMAAADSAQAVKRAAPLPMHLRCTRTRAGAVCLKYIAHTGDCEWPPGGDG